MDQKCEWKFFNTQHRNGWNLWKRWEISIGTWNTKKWNPGLYIFSQLLFRGIIPALTTLPWPYPHPHLHSQLESHITFITTLIYTLILILFPIFTLILTTPSCRSSPPPLPFSSFLATSSPSLFPHLHPYPPHGHLYPHPNLHPYQHSHAHSYLYPYLYHGSHPHPYLSSLLPTTSVITYYDVFTENPRTLWEPR